MGDRRINLFLMLAVALLTVSAASLAGASPMSDQRFEAWKKAYNEERTALIDSGEATRERMAEFYNSVMDQLRIEDLKPSQIAYLSDKGLLNYSVLSDQGRDYTDRARAAARRWAKQRGAEGAVAAAVVAELSMTRDTTKNQDVQWIRTVLQHPGLRDAVRQGRAYNLNALLAHRLNADVRAELEADLRRYARLLADAHPVMAFNASSLYESLQKLVDVENLDELEPIRTGLIALIDRAVEAAEAGDDIDLADAGARMRYERNILVNAPEVARLVGRPAPELDIIWTNSNESIASLADLRGKVVVLDFWATWCGPCVSSFPNVRKLADHYEGYPVEIVGVTSPQGSTVFRDDRGRVKAASNDEEFAQMEEYIDHQDINWTIAFTSQDVFNAEYGVRGIPHVAILDPDGVLRHRGLHPGSDLPGKVETINALLKEFNLPAPNRPID